MEEKSYHYLVLFTGLLLCLLHSGGVSSSCDNISQIDFAEITYEPEGLAPHSDGTVARIECGVFYQILPTTFEITTCTNGSWTGRLPRCRHVPRYCQRNEALVQIYGQDCQTQCRNHPNGGCPGNKRCHCDGVCGWSCISIYEDNFCPEVADQAGLLVTYDPPERRFNGFADLSCGEGYIYHSGSSRLLCMSNRQWGGGNNFVCIPNGVSSSCDNIYQIDFAEITYEPEGLAPHSDGTVARIECGVFYQILPTTFERTTCTNGSWTGPLPQCRHVPRYCQRNEALVQIYGRDCQTQCRNRLNGACPENKQCHCDGVCGWSCISIYEDDFCPEVADEAGLLVTYDPPERRFNGYANFSCGEGYIYHSGSSRLLCMSNRQWGGGNNFVCIPNDNQNPVVTCPADFTSDTLTVSFTVDVTDNADPAPALTYNPLGPGSIFPLGPTTVSVTATDSSSNQDSCTFTVTVTERMERLCSKPGYISHVVQYVNGLETNRLDTYPHDELPEGTFLVSRCSLPGQYVLRGSANRTCSGGSWTGEQPRCDEADTKIVFQNNQPLDVRSTGTIVIHPRSQLYIYCQLPSYSIARFEAENGPYAFYRGLSTMVMSLYPPRTSQSGWFTCRSNDNTLSHTVNVQFAEIYCDSPTAPTNGDIRDYETGWKYERYYMGKEITFACNDGYILDGERRITCVLGEWSHPVPRCQQDQAL